MIKLFLVLIYIPFSFQRCEVTNNLFYDDDLEHFEQRFERKWIIRDISWCLHYSDIIQQNYSYIERDLEKAFKEWSFYIDLNFYKIYCSNNKKANINIGMEPINTTFLNLNIKSLHILGKGFYPPNQANPDDFSISTLFNGNTTWRYDIDNILRDKNFYQDNEKTIFYTTALHEIGHNLGLIHIDGKCNIMFPMYNKILELQPDDVKAALQLYRPNPKRTDGRSYRETINNIYPMIPRYPKTNPVYQPKVPPRFPPRFPPPTNSPKIPINPEIPINPVIPKEEEEDVKQKKLKNNNMDFFFNPDDNKYKEIISKSKSPLKYLLLKGEYYFVFELYGRNLKHPFVVNKNNKVFVSFI